ncbi:DEAD/DEAH box helicase [Sporichthya sp.]|uniref:DEAD/DEAH box helicase n=1 Tax=Sporichthya sp. TaxID=65475 RepID=UPI00180C37FF|nr:DEAD/DEAH box helicase [Sporichthya sp.]MBA3745438.1 DEAD/DEAH box helicase family protein [Sporichthya sp.]
MSDDAFRRQLAELRQENERLKKLLRLTKFESEPAPGTQTAWFDRAPGPVNAGSPPEAKVAFYTTLFGARRDVYAVRWENPRLGKSGWMPAVEGGWSKGKQDDPRYLPLTPDVVAAHLRGALHIGLYPMLPGDETCWLAADFDGSAAMLDALAYLKAARALGAPAALEVSRSGVGAHVWIFFTGPVPAITARQLGTGLVREAIALRGHMALSCYDRLFPSQDTVPTGRFGNLIAAPLHGTSRKENRTTVFLDLATLEPYDDQWDYMSTLDRLEPKQVSKIAARVREPTVGVKVQRLHPTTATKTQPRSAPVVHLTLDGGVRVPGGELTPAQYATFKHAASMANPEFYDRQRRRQSTWNIPRFIQSFDETLDGHLVLPRGLLDTALRVVEQAGSKADIRDQRISGAHIEVAFTADLTPGQHDAVQRVLAHDLGLLVAPPGSGKTVMACAVIAKQAVSTLVLVDRKTLADQWRKQIQSLLGVKPGQIGGGRSKLTGVIDIATLQTLARRDDLGEKLAPYGFVIADECHHIPAAAFEAAVRTIPARRWLGLTATPYRRDQLDDLIAFQLGPVRHEFTPPKPGTLENAVADRPEPVLLVHPTSFTYESTTDFSIPGAIAGVHRALAEDESRNAQILADVREALSRHRNCLLLAQRTAHVDLLAKLLAADGYEPVVLKGGMGSKARAGALERLQPQDDAPPLLAVGTGSFVGEGFDCPALDTLFLAGPVSFKGRLVQYAGRVLRAYPGKTTAEVHDYHDANVPVLAAALAKRAPGYISLGFPDPRRQ